MFIRGQLYICLGIEWLTQGGVVKLFFVFIRAKPQPPTPQCCSYTCYTFLSYLGIEWQWGIIPHTNQSRSARVRMCAVGRSGHAWFKLLPTEHVTERSNARIVIDVVTNNSPPAHSFTGASTSSRIQESCRTTRFQLNSIVGAMSGRERPSEGVRS